MDTYQPHLIPVLPYQQILEMMIKSYAGEYGSRKLEKVVKKALGAASVQKLIRESKVNKHRISKEEILTSVVSHPYFLFAKFRTKAIGALIVLNEWDQQVNSKVEIYDENEMQKLASEMMAEMI